jgi:hypothetical protein
MPNENDIECCGAVMEKKVSKDIVLGSCCLTFTILIIVLLATGITTISSTEVGVEYKTVEAKLVPDLILEGLHGITPFSQVIRWPVIYQTTTFTGPDIIDCNSKDGLQIILDVSFQYVPQISKIYELTKIYKDFDNYKLVLNATARSSIRHTCSDFTSVDFQRSRSLVHNQLEQDVRKSIQDVLYSTVVELQLRNIDRPRAYENSVETAEAARSDIPLALNEREQRLTSSKTKLVESKQAANKTLDSATTRAEVILTAANIEAETIVHWYDIRKDVYSRVKDTLGLSVEELLSYLGNELFGSRGKLVSGEPSQLIY